MVPVGLGARDTLRLEMGYLLSGTDFDGRQSSLQTGPEWVVKWEHHFVGKRALLEQKKRNDLSRLVCLELLEKGIPRHGYRIGFEGKDVGAVTGGTLSPCLHKGIAMGYVPPDLAKEGTAIGCDDQGQARAGTSGACTVLPEVIAWTGQSQRPSSICC